MINRELIRLKVVQLVYAYYRDGEKNIESTEKELMFSLSKSYDMYRYLLLTICEVYECGVRALEIRRSRARRLNITEDEDTAFADNRFARQLAENKQLAAFRDKVGAEWIDEALIRKLYRTIIESEPQDKSTYLCRRPRVLAQSLQGILRRLRRARRIL